MGTLGTESMRASFAIAILAAALSATSCAAASEGYINLYKSTSCPDGEDAASILVKLGGCTAAFFSTSGAYYKAEQSGTTVTMYFYSDSSCDGTLVGTDAWTTAEKDPPNLGSSVSGAPAQIEVEECKEYPSGYPSNHDWKAFKLSTSRAHPNRCYNEPECGGPCDASGCSCTTDDCPGGGGGGSDGLSGGAIAAIVIVILLVVGVAVFLFIWCHPSMEDKK